MKLKMFGVFDEKAKAYFPPFFYAETGMALRTFSDCCNDRSHQFGKHPSDYTLFSLGVFDCMNGSVTPGLQEVVANGVQVLTEVVP